MSEAVTKPRACEAQSVQAVGGSGYPEPFCQRVATRSKRRLGEVFGLGQFGVNLVTLAPGAQSALRHWHTHEDEFVYVLQGQLVLVTDEGETALAAGMCSGFRAGERNGHHLLNRSDQPAQYLEVGARIGHDLCVYPDDDLLSLRDADGEYWAHKNKHPYS